MMQAGSIPVAEIVATRLMVPAQTTSTNQRIQLTGMGVAGISLIMLRVICSVCNLGTLIPASIAVKAINEVAELYNENGAEYENAGSYRAAAGWLIFVASSAIICHVITIIIFVLYMYAIVEKHFKLFTAVNAILCVLFALAFLAGLIVNAIYAAENSNLHFDLCLSYDSVGDDELCRQLESVYESEGVSAGLSFVSMMFFAVIALFTLRTYTAAASSTGSNCYYIEPQVSPTHQPTNMSAYPPPNTSQYVPPPGPSYPSAYTSQYPSPSAPAYPPTQHVSPAAPYNPTTNQPSHIPPNTPLKPEDNAPANLPSHETTVAANHTVPQPVPSGEPVEESKMAPVP